jgi:hypothetical protein
MNYKKAGNEQIDSVLMLDKISTYFDSELLARSGLYGFADNE